MRASNQRHRRSLAMMLGALATLAACATHECDTGVVKDQTHFEGELYSAAIDYDIVHGTAHFGAVCDRDGEVDCPNGDVAEPVIIVIDEDWRPSRLRLDLAKPVFGTEGSATEMERSGYVKLARFPGLVFQPEVVVICDGETASGGWPNFLGVVLRDDMIDDYGIEHEGLRQAIERGIEDGSDEVSEMGGTAQLLCGPPS